MALPVLQEVVGAVTDAPLIAAGWERRFLVGGDRMAEMIALYRELGYEVKAEAVPREGLDPSCDSCLSGQVAHHILYTRRPPAGGAQRPPREERS
jgi:hypothetical protein